MNFQFNRVLVTGAAGFIGFHLSRRLLKDGCHVTGIDNLNSYYDVKLKEARLESLTPFENFSFYNMDISDRKSLEAIFNNTKYDVVVNLAAQAGVRYSIENPQAYVDSNIVGFVNLLECCRHNDVKHLVFASSSSVYGANTKMPFSVHNNVDHPVSLYAATKKANELMAHAYSHLYGMHCTGLRFFTVYGPWGRPDMALFLFTKAILEEKPIKVFNHGRMQRDFTYIDDIIEGVVRIMGRLPEPDPTWNGDNPDPGTSYARYKIYNIGNNNPVELMEFIGVIEKILGKKAKKEFLDLQPGDVPATYADIDDLIKDVGFKPETSIETGIKQFILWYNEYYG
ncbi:MAG: NAD-dependent epimerase [Proteobacteria bacterium]|nr:NAD-dependent epimerase [Pseudomonadota bacterium]MBU4013841.1 NAD-dependent epimerase [Pseudomonadota bacterium]MBU4068543.1 NAD-dependent epimerase [Pseudomonadota bacterium]MBU4125967.1 NAD-dependent epimerase [Pseudomonadota bacterium]